ncbi:hypothetical protein ACIHAR_00945 [Streptomyces sp. NPDC052016]|uniref:hypothetical protein n=1 Tax=Streptomyces sp. NPDC052016 TaxID=3365680 RepID=UPI0037D85BEC
MSRSVFVLRYREGEPEPLDMALVREVLGPYVIAADEDFQGGVLIRAADGHEVEVDVNEVCLAVSRYPPGRFFDILAELVDRLGASVSPTDRPVVLRREEDRAHLPAEAQRGAVTVAMTGRAMENFLGGS